MRNSYSSEELSLLRIVGAHLRLVRLEMGLSQESMAELAGLNRNYLGDVERGERNISILNLIRFARACDKLLRDIFPPDL